MIDNKTSLLVKHQLPEFVRDNPDYDNFTLFVKAYYEWMELANTANAESTTAHSYNQGVTHAAKSLIANRDIDTSIDEFADYYVNEFLPYFPKGTLINKAEAIKVARQLYQSKGTPASYEFLFRVLYNSDFDIFFTKDAVLKASDGDWYVPKSLKLASTDETFLNISQLRVFGETTKSIATVETSVVSGNKIEVFISNIERLFQSGEFIRVVDSNNRDVYFKNGQIVAAGTSGSHILRAKIVGQISSITVDPNNRGNNYKAGDPVIVYGGLTSNTGHGAIASVGSVTAGFIKRVNVINGGYGYSYFPNTEIIFGSDTNGANATVYSLNTDPTGTTNRANVALIATDTIGYKKDITIGNSHYQFANMSTANANTKLINAFTFEQLQLYPISSVVVNYGGGGLIETPSVIAKGGYESDLVADQLLLNYSSQQLAANTPDISSLGILSPIVISNGGSGYQNNETIIFTGGSGVGAYANVTVNSTGAIIKVDYVQDSQRRYPLGGMGYKNNYLPNITVNTIGGANASLYVPSILGTGAELSAVSDKAGEVVTISISDFGEDYDAVPQVSLRVLDILSSNIIYTNLPEKGEYVYQGDSLETATFIASVNSASSLIRSADPLDSKWLFRIFEYNTLPDPTKPLIIDRPDGQSLYINMITSDGGYAQNHFYTGSPAFDKNGIKQYGQGDAKATAKFLNGLVIGQGQYLNSKGQPSSFNVLQSSVYNNFTYQITVQESISKYRDTLINLLHPIGMKVVGRNALKSTKNYTYTIEESLYTGVPMRYYTGNNNTYATVSADFTNKSNNQVTFHNWPLDVNLSDFIIEDSTRLMLTPTNGYNIDAKVIAVNDVANTVTLDSNTWLTFGNVATITAESGSNTINITALTGQYDMVNNGYYSNTAYPLMDIVFAGDRVLIDNNSSLIVETVDYANNIIYTTTNVSSNANSLMSVCRTFIANTNIQYDQIKLYGPIGVPYSHPSLITEDGYEITTEDGSVILLG